jgi:hypothetical protein
MRIAVCLSGQPRVIDYAAQSILNFFSGEHQYDFFCHTWDYNSYKRKKENPEIGEFPVWWEKDVKVDVEQLKNSLALFNPKKYIIHDAHVLGKRFIWDSLMYSLMYANNLKKQYEIENNFRYDFVVKSRYDTIFSPDRKFVLNKRADKDNYLDSFCIHDARMTYEYNRVNTSDNVFYGTSLGMDMICDVYRHIYIKMKNIRLDDFEYLGPGSYISDYAEGRNLRLIAAASELFETVYRKEMIPQDPVANFPAFREFNQSMYRRIYD